MNKKIFLSVLTGITVLAIIFGSIYHISNIGERIGRFIPFINHEEKESYENTFDKDDIKGIDLDAELLSIKIKEGNDDKIRVKYSGSKRLKPDTYLIDDVLFIEQNGDNSYLGTKNKINCFLYLELPKGFSLDDISISLDLGNLEAERLDAKNLYIDLDLGNVEIKEFRSDDAEITADLGNVSIKKADLKNLSCEASLGNITIESENDLKDYALSLSADAGNVKFNKKKVKSEFSQDGDKGEITLECDLGNIELY